MAKVKKGGRRARRARRTPEERATILATAQKEGLTAKDVQKRFGVPIVTYYSWRKNSKRVKRGTRRAAAGASRNGLVGSKVREAVAKRLRTTLPRLIEREVERYLSEALGSGRRGRG